MTWRRQSNRIVPADWKARKTRAFAEHQRVCHVCLHPDADEIDHILNVARGGTHEADNLAPIHGKACQSCGRRCHVEKTAMESAAGRTRHRRTPERHPGLR
jgi:5-methylcytosine-specific restriction endonuclease McrA